MRDRRTGRPHKPGWVGGRVVGVRAKMWGRRGCRWLCWCVGGSSDSNKCGQAIPASAGSVADTVTRRVPAYALLCEQLCRLRVTPGGVVTDR
jgi:hypothetical protein